MITDEKIDEVIEVLRAADKHLAIAQGMLKHAADTADIFIATGIEDAYAMVADDVRDNVAKAIRRLCQEHPITGSDRHQHSTLNRVQQGV